MQPNGGKRMKIDYKSYAVGFCSHSERTTIKGGALSAVNFPALCFSLTHPKIGTILFDTGFSSRFTEICRHFPDSLYNVLLPIKMKKEDDFCVQLQKYQKIKPEDVSFIIISHFHVDHIAGLLNFPNARFICSREAYEAVKDLGRVSALIKAFSAKLLPSDFRDRCEFIEDKEKVNFSSNIAKLGDGYDLFSDGSITAIHLPGHAQGQYGILFQDQSNKTVLLCADACWSSEAFRSYKLPLFITRLIHSNWQAYKETLRKLHILHKADPNIKIIPSHCREVLYEGK